LLMVRLESQYFRPQLKTKIMNEGWATFWHKRIMRELPLTDAEYTEFAQLNAQIQMPTGTSVNPYTLGVQIWEDLNEKVSRDRFFEIREIEEDQGFLRNHLTKEIVEALDLYVFTPDRGQGVWRVETKDWETVRGQLVESRVNGGLPM